MRPKTIFLIAELSVSLLQAGLIAGGKWAVFEKGANGWRMSLFVGLAMLCRVPSQLGGSK